ADRKSPIAYGYDEKLAIYFNQAPLIQVAGGGGPGGFGGGGGGGGGRGAGGGGGGGQTGANRASGRGSITDPDVVQGRPPLAPAGPPSEDALAQIALQQPPPEMRPRVVLRFSDVSD